MSKPDPVLATQRAARDSARAVFNSRLAAAKVDLAPAELKRRVVAEAQRSTLSVAHQAIEIANDSRGVVAATVAALALWLARKPIMAGAARLTHRFRTRKTMPRRVADQAKLLLDGYWRRLKEYADE